jgi:predicted Rossmann-fold nucleotide-binding protein
MVRVILTVNQAESNIIKLFDHGIIDKGFAKSMLNKLMKLTDTTTEEFRKIEEELNNRICGR